jgi:L-threonylcarbamoyladenylate synthase
MGDATAEMTRIVSTTGNDLALVVNHLAAGGIAAIPTETVYGLAADAADPAAVAAIYAAKGRPGINPLIVHVSDRAMAGRYARFLPLADRLAAAFWPGALTLVLPRLADAPLAAAVTAGLDTVALRVPAHPVMQAVVRGLGRGIAAPSANASGRLTATSAAHVRLSLEGRVPLVVDGGPSPLGLESTIVAVAGDQLTLLREGALPRAALEAVAGQGIALVAEGADIAAPGMLLRHYAPSKPLRLNAQSAGDGEFHIGFGAIPGDVNLSASADLAEAAARLFDALHQADASKAPAIAVAPIPAGGLGAAINDRLRRAARG